MSTNQQIIHCFICGLPTYKLNNIYHCSGCGKYQMQNDLETLLDENKNDINKDKILFLTYLRNRIWKDCLIRFVRDKGRLDFSGYYAIITKTVLEDAIKNYTYIDITEQIENALLATGTECKYAYKGYGVPFVTLKSKTNIDEFVYNKELLFSRLIGIPYEPALEYDWEKYCFNNQYAVITNYRWMDLYQELTLSGEFKESSLGEGHLILSAKGCESYKNILKGNITSDVAFMAMGFTDRNRLAYNKIFVPAVESCGFKLHTVDELPDFGGISDDMELKIRRAPFVIVDVSEGNKGAYWEAGYATGFGKKVLYTCDEESFNSTDRMIKPHFDIIHRNIIKWKGQIDTEIEAHKQEPIKRLKAAIRNTIPGAKLDD